MNRYLVFFGDIYYPGCGMDDLVTSHENLEDAQKEADNKLYNSTHSGYVWAQIYDSKIEQTIFSKEIRGFEEPHS